jgi:hypothetical protein
MSDPRSSHALDNVVTMLIFVMKRQAVLQQVLFTKGFLTREDFDQAEAECEARYALEGALNPNPLSEALLRLTDWDRRARSQDP